MLSYRIKQTRVAWAKQSRSVLTITLLATCSLVSADSSAAPQQNSSKHQTSGLEIRFKSKEWIAPTELINLDLSRPLKASEESIGIFVGQTDVTALFELTGKRLRYSSQALPLPVGETRLVVYLVSVAGEWSEVASFPLRVKDANGSVEAAKDHGNKGAHGFDKLEVRPSASINLKAQSAVLYFPQTERPDRINSIDLAFQGSLQTNLTHGEFKHQNQFDFIGTTVQKEALRFGERNNEAPQIDLSSYLLQVQVKKVKIVMGHHSYGNNRYFIDGFSSRGLNVSVPLSSRFDLSFNAASGTSVVGWNNFTGLGRRKHNVIASTLGYELFPEHPGRLRFEVGALRGSLLPLNNVNERTLTDAETSNGVGTRVVATDRDNRLRIEFGFGRSRFGNPADPLLSQGFSIIPVRETSRNARYLEVSYQILKDYTAVKDRKANLSFTFRHNRVDPLFRSVAVSTQADRLDNQLELTGSLGDITATVGHNRLNDNLDDIPSILKTLTRRSGLNLSVPLVSIFHSGSTGFNWLPRLAYNYDRTHAFGAFLPVNSDFALSHVPDQASTSHSFNADWQREKLRFGYRFNHSLTDNRQTGREFADFKTMVNTLTFGITPQRRLELNLDLSSERASNLEVARLDSTWRTTFGATLQTTKKSTLAANISTAFAGDAANTSQSRNADLDLQWSWRFGIEKDKYRKVQGQFYIRYANRYTRATDRVFLFTNLTKLQTMSAGLSFTFF